MQERMAQTPSSNSLRFQSFTPSWTSRLAPEAHYGTLVQQRLGLG